MKKNRKQKEKFQMEGTKNCAKVKRSYICPDINSAKKCLREKY